MEHRSVVRFVFHPATRIPPQNYATYLVIDEDDQHERHRSHPPCPAVRYHTKQYTMDHETVEEYSWHCLYKLLVSILHEKRAKHLYKSSMSCKRKTRQVNLQLLNQR